MKMIMVEGTIEEIMELFEDKIKEKPKSGRFKWDNDYGAWFDNECVGWSKDPKYNKMFLTNQEIIFNDLLKARGHLFLNEVYDALGIPRSEAGQIVGWIYEDGKSYVDFGLKSEKNKDFYNGLTTDAMLDFNVDGIIIDKI